MPCTDRAELPQTDQVILQDTRPVFSRSLSTESYFDRNVSGQLAGSFSRLVHRETTEINRPPVLASSSISCTAVLTASGNVETDLQDAGRALVILVAVNS